MKPEQAEAIALQALAFLSGDPAALGGFLATSGCGPREIKERLNDPGFLGGVLDYLLSDEALLLRFCADHALPPQTPAQARRVLPGAMDYG